MNMPLAAPLNTPRLTESFFEGTFRIELTGNTCHDVGGAIRHGVVLDDYRGHRLAWLPPGAGWLATLPRIATVRVLEQAPDPTGPRQIVRLQVPTADRLPDGATLLPRRKCPAYAHAALEGFVAFCVQLPLPLRRLMSVLMLDETIALPLLRCRFGSGASEDRPGQLLVTLADTLDRLRMKPRADIPDGRVADRALDLARAGYVLHLIGKIHTLGDGLIPPAAAGQAYWTQSATMCQAPLGRLTATDSGLAAQLKDVLRALEQHALRPASAASLAVSMLETLHHVESGRGRNAAPHDADTQGSRP